MEIEWTVGPIPIEDKHGKEVVLRYASALESGESTSPRSSKQCSRGLHVIFRVRPWAALHTGATLLQIKQHSSPLCLVALVHLGSKSQVPELEEYL